MERAVTYMDKVRDLNPDSPVKAINTGQAFGHVGGPVRIIEQAGGVKVEPLEEMGPEQLDDMAWREMLKEKNALSSDFVSRTSKPVESRDWGGTEVVYCFPYAQGGQGGLGGVTVPQVSPRNAVVITASINPCIIRVIANADGSTTFMHDDKGMNGEKYMMGPEDRVMATVKAGWTRDKGPDFQRNQNAEDAANSWNPYETNVVFERIGESWKMNHRTLWIGPQKEKFVELNVAQYDRKGGMKIIEQTSTPRDTPKSAILAAKNDHEPKEYNREALEGRDALLERLSRETQERAQKARELRLLEEAREACANERNSFLGLAGGPLDWWTENNPEELRLSESFQDRIDGMTGISAVKALERDMLFFDGVDTAIKELRGSGVNGPIGIDDKKKLYDRALEIALEMVANKIHERSSMKACPV